MIKLVLFLAYVTYRVEELSVTVTKEFALEKAMAKMKEEWKDMEFEFKPYRETVSMLNIVFFII